jgi:outer membrane lipoprotein SlyB
MRARILCTALLLPLLAACRSGPRVIVDPQGVDQAAYQRDLADCTIVSDQVRPGASAGKGALAGAVVGGAVGAIVGDRSTAARLGGVGAVVGGAKGAGQGAENRDQVLKNCMRGRGYRVLN